MKKKETLDFLKGTTMDGIINNANAAAVANTNPVEKVATKVQAPPGPSVSSEIPPAKKSSTKKTAVDVEHKIFTNVRIKKSLLKQARLILGDGKKTQAIVEHVFSEFIKKNKKVLAQNVEKEIENLKSTLK